MKLVTGNDMVQDSGWIARNVFKFHTMVAAGFESINLKEIEKTSNLSFYGNCKAESTKWVP